jgi:hypothetical protein
MNAGAANSPRSIGISLRHLAAMAGVAIWLAACLLLRLPLEAVILLFAPLVLVPLGLELIETPAIAAGETCLLLWIKRLQLPAAAVLAVSFSRPQGPLATAWAVPWLSVTGLMALLGMFRFRRLGWRLDGEAAVTTALLFILVGGGWAVISQAGLRPQAFSHAIVLLTAVHFHYAGFALPLLASRAVPAGLSSRMDRLVLLCILGGVPAVGVGISLSPHIEVVAAIALATGCLLLAKRQTEAAWAAGNARRLTLAVVSSLSLIAAMALAAIYAVGHFAGREWLDIPTMIRTHGAFNAFGFAACGIAAHVFTNK